MHAYQCYCQSAVVGNLVWEACKCLHYWVKFGSPGTRIKGFLHFRGFDFAQTYVNTFKIGQPWIANQGNSNLWIINETGDNIQIHWLVYIFQWWHQNQQGGTSLWYGMWHYHVAWWNFEEIHTHTKISFSLNVMVGYCVCIACWSGVECLWLCWKGREPSWKTGIISQLSGKGIVESLLFGLVGHAHFYASGNVCKLAPF